MLLARYVSKRHRDWQPIRLSFVDIRKAYFNALPERAIFMRVPKEMGLPPNTVARQVRCVYGTRDAGKLWEDTYMQVLEGLDLRQEQVTLVFFTMPSATSLSWFTVMTSQP